MFTGIVEAQGEVAMLQREGKNLHFGIKAPFLKELKADQSVAHNGVCLTVTGIEKDYYTVTAIDSTLGKTNLGSLKKGDKVNLERCLRIGDRLDGHLVQGHVDQTGICKNIQESDGSWIFTFQYAQDSKNLTVEKGSICVNGVSLTVVDSKKNEFSVAIIPYTFQHTNFRELKPGNAVNLEFDIVGKYVASLVKETV